MGRHRIEIEFDADIEAAERFLERMRREASLARKSWNVEVSMTPVVPTTP